MWTIDSNASERAVVDWVKKNAPDLAHNDTNDTIKLIRNAFWEAEDFNGIRLNVYEYKMLYY